MRLKYHFQILSSKKSFAVYAKNVREKQAWMDDINQCIQAVEEHILALIYLLSYDCAFLNVDLVNVWC